MTDEPNGLDEQLRAYYEQLSRRPAPDLTDKVMMAAGTRSARLRRLTAAGGAIAVAAVVVALVVVGLANHGRPTGAAPGQSSTPLPSFSSTPFAPTPTPSASTPTATPVVPVAPPVQGFVPTDVTAISADEWWVLGYNGPSCSSAACTRIVHTTDGGHTFTSLPVPPVAPAQGSQQALRLRFADPVDGWVVTAGGDIWATHDGGQHWMADAVTHQVTDLEASGGSVYAIVCLGTSCSIQKSPTGHDSWMVLPASDGTHQLSDLNVNGNHAWAAIGSSSSTGAGSLLTSTDGGQSFSTHPVCSPDLGFGDVYAVDANVLWVTCPTGTQAAIFRPTDGGQHFTIVGDPGIPNSASMAGVSATDAVVTAGQALWRTVDGGHSFTTVENNQTRWSIVGFTTASNGFAFDNVGSTQSALWRTNDAGATWFMVHFP